MEVGLKPYFYEGQPFTAPHVMFYLRLSWYDFQPFLFFSLRLACHVR